MGRYTNVCLFYTAVENLAYKKDSFVNNRRQYKRHTRRHQQSDSGNEVVDGDHQQLDNHNDLDTGVHSCTVLDNFYVEVSPTPNVLFVAHLESLSPVQTERDTRRRASTRQTSTRQMKLMLKIVSIHTDRVDARQVICIHPKSDVSLSYTYYIGYWNAK